MSGGRSSATKNSCFVQNSIENIYNRLNRHNHATVYLWNYTCCWLCSITCKGIYRRGNNPDSKVHGAYIGPTWGRHDPGGPHVGPMNLVIWEWLDLIAYKYGTSTWMFEYSKDVFKNGLQMNISLLTTVHVHEMKALLYTLHEGNTFF